MKVHIVDTTVETKEGIAKLSRQPYKLRMQSAVLDQGELDRRPFKLMLAPLDPAYAVGVYSLSPGFLTVNEYGELSIARDVRLVPLVARAAPPSAAVAR